MHVAPRTIIKSLEATERPSVMALVSAAGIDVSDWSFTSRGIPIKTEPAKNGRFCYEWTFGNTKEGFVICIWHGSLEVAELDGVQEVVFRENLRQLAQSLDAKADSSRSTPGEKSRSRAQGHRAHNFDSTLQHALNRRVPVRVIINEGDRKEDEELGTASAQVRKRKLDPETWWMHSYDLQTGSPLLVRGRAPDVPEDDKPDSPQVEPDESAHPLEEPAYVDQFSVSPAPTSQTTVTVRERSPAVRQKVLRRAGGYCERCGKPGFQTASGSVYLETHHIIPLSEDGPDHDTNVVALCPGDHRQAHFSVDRDEVRSELQAVARNKCSVAD